MLLATCAGGAAVVLTGAAAAGAPGRAHAVSAAAVVVATSQAGVRTRPVYSSPGPTARFAADSLGVFPSRGGGAGSPLPPREAREIARAAGLDRPLLQVIPHAPA